jgi:hypothetical protein
MTTEQIYRPIAKHKITSDVAAVGDKLLGMQSFYCVVIIQNKAH